MNKISRQEGYNFLRRFWTRSSHDRRVKGVWDGWMVRYEARQDIEKGRRVICQECATDEHCSRSIHDAKYCIRQ